MKLVCEKRGKEHAQWTDEERLHVLQDLSRMLRSLNQRGHASLLVFPSHGLFQLVNEFLQPRQLAI